MPQMRATRIVRPKQVKKVLICKPAAWSKKYPGINGKQDVVEAWFKGQDFYSTFTSYFSVRNSAQLRKEGYTHICIENDNREIPLV